MHLRGKDMTIYGLSGRQVANAPQRTSFPSFSWQDHYSARPLSLPAGTRVEVTAHWDNSANNPWNPDSRKTVRWGNQSWDEMLSLPMGVITDRD